MKIHLFVGSVKWEQLNVHLEHYLIVDRSSMQTLSVSFSHHFDQVRDHEAQFPQMFDRPLFFNC
jgi:hypothetical protein